MSNLYLLINLFVLVGPLALSFDKKVAFYRTWKALFIAIAVMALIYIPWDMYFTLGGIWGFNKVYLTGVKLGNLPIEEVLFFITVPYACAFIYACVSAYLVVKMRDWVKNISVGAIVLLLLFVMIKGVKQDYSFYTSLCTLITVVVFFIVHRDNQFWGNFIVSYLISMIPFLLVNGLLTGSTIENEVVWYNSNHIFNVRIFTIPVEDMIYNLGMLLLTIGVYEWVKKRSIE